MQCLKELFEAASSKDAPYGIPNYPQARAFYAVDLMLKWDTDSEGRLSCSIRLSVMVASFKELNLYRN